MSKGFEVDATRLRAALSAAAEKLGDEEFEALSYMFREQDRLIEESREVYEETGLTPRQVAEQRAELLGLAKDSLDWHRGDKWRDSEIPSQREAWERRRNWIEQCIAQCIAPCANATQQRNANGGEG